MSEIHGDMPHVPYDGSSPEFMNEQERIDAALKVAMEDGTTDGGHHKMWAID